MDIRHFESNVNCTDKSSQQGAVRDGLKSSKCPPKLHQILELCHALQQPLLTKAVSSQACMS